MPYFIEQHGDTYAVVRYEKAGTTPGSRKGGLILADGLTEEEAEECADELIAEDTIKDLQDELTHWKEAADYWKESAEGWRKLYWELMGRQS